MESYIKKEFQKLNKRFDKMEARMVTKDDAKHFATKDDLKPFATKDDLKPFATKDELKAFATKDDLKSFATKGDLKPFATKEDLKPFTTKEDLKPFAIKDDLKSFYTKEDLKAQTKELKAFAVEQTEELARIVSRGFDDVLETLDVRERVTKVEKKMAKIEHELNIEINI